MNNLIKLKQVCNMTEERKIERLKDNLVQMINSL